MSPLVVVMMALSVTAVVGLAIGSIKFKGIKFGVVGALFSGLIFGYFLKKFNVDIPNETLGFVKMFGFILFVYGIGNQVGPTFFSVLRKNGLKLSLLSCLIILASVLVDIIIYKFSGLDLPVVLGLLSGGVTSTPSLGAVQQVLKEIGMSAEDIIKPSVAYAVAYPFGIAGALLVIQLIKIVFRVDIEKEEDEFLSRNVAQKPIFMGKTVLVNNKSVDNKKIGEIINFFSSDCIITRLLHGDEVIVPHGDTVLSVGDAVYLFGEKASVDKFTKVLGVELPEGLPRKLTELDVEKFAVTKTKVLGHSIPALGVNEANNIVVSRITRSGIDLLPTPSVRLHFGDIITVIGKSNGIKAAARIFGNKEGALKEAQIIPIFVAIAFGILLGILPIHVPGATVPVKLGLAGGPLVASIVFSRIGNIGPLVWFMPPSANHILREIGITLFLAVVGLQSGDKFVHTVTHGDGLLWMGYGAIITFVPIFAVGVLARFLKMNFLIICGLITGTMTNSPALAFANTLSSKTQAATQAYATVYPLAMFLRVLAPQIMIMFLC
jgi:putative transport protein